jgi:anthranilate/para-aminobenzoate synthase component II
VKILFIDNEDKLIANIKSLLYEADITFVDYEESGFYKSESFDLVIISGNSNFAVPGNEDIYTKQIELVKTSSTPILGISLGSQIVAYSYGAFIQSNNPKNLGVTRLKAVENDIILKNIPVLDVHGSNRFSIKKLPHSLKPIAISDSGVEIYRHRKKLIYGLQFHPDSLLGPSNMQKLIFNFMNLVVSTVPK